MPLVLLIAGARDEQRQVLDYVGAGHVDGVLLISSHAGNPVMESRVAQEIPTIACGIPLGFEGWVGCVAADDLGGGRQMTRHLLDLGRTVVATITGSLDTPGGRLRKAGRTVPGEVAVGGFDDSGLVATLDPPLTTVHQPFERISAEMVRLMMEVIDVRTRPRSPSRRHSWSGRAPDWHRGIGGGVRRRTGGRDWLWAGYERFSLARLHGRDADGPRPARRHGSRSPTHDQHDDVHEGDGRADHEGQPTARPRPDDAQDDARSRPQARPEGWPAGSDHGDDRAGGEQGEREDPGGGLPQPVRRPEHSRAGVVGEVGQHVEEVRGDPEQRAGDGHPQRGHAGGGEGERDDRRERAEGHGIRQG